MEEVNRCEKCLALHGHHPECPSIDFETAKKDLIMYYHSWLKMENVHRENVKDIREKNNIKINKAKKEAEFWKGKFSTVKLENNKLRSKILK